MRVGFVQIAPILGDRDATIAKIEGLLAEQKLPDLLVLPELCNSGYNFSGPEQARELAEDPQNSPFLDFLAGYCRRDNCYIITGLNERAGEKLYNTSILLGPEGILGKYRKLHLFLNEKDYFTPGDLGLPVFVIGDIKIGMLICFDWIFPEAWRVLALKGADIICHPSNLVLPGMAQKGIAVHAMINRYYVILANRMGSEGNLTFTGLSTIVDPTGAVLTQATAEEECCQVVEIDPERARHKNVTARNHVLADRRPDEYRLLIEP